MADRSLSLEWSRTTPSFNYDSYSRNHIVRFGDGGAVCSSSAPEFHGDPRCLDPEQAFVMSLASCHLLTFLAIASKKGYTVDKYIDKSAAELGKNKQGKSAIVKVELRPAVTFSGEKIPSLEEFNALHDRAHRGCIVANTIDGNVAIAVIPTQIIANSQ